jgi:acyl-CoA thioester hydrolase
LNQRVHCSTVRVRYAETDQMSVAYHGNYFAWFEVGRTDLLRDHGFTYRDLESQGVRLPIIEAHVKYLRPARYDDVLEIRTRIAEMTGVRVSFDYEVVRAGAPGVLATATTAHAAVDPEGRPRRFPAQLREAFARLQAAPDSGTHRGTGSTPAAREKAS